MSSHVDNAFVELDTTLADMNSRRARMIVLMEDGLDKLNLDPNNDSPRITEVKLALLKTLDDLYKGQENISMAKVKLALSRVDTQTNQSVSAIAIEMIKKIEMTDGCRFAGKNTNNVDDDSSLEAAAKSAGVEVDDKELANVVESKPKVEIKESEFALEEE